ncbi:helix-turn-helix domain-containing protein [Yersinia enterocolitica]|uniref:helix-turn-helix domain-containing protein n=1 Tax=Yersinia enterocolitica TaxID=630 RepID=UPI003D07F946
MDRLPQAVASVHQGRRWLRAVAIRGGIACQLKVVERARRMFANGASLHQVALVLEVSPKTIYKYIPAEDRLALASA